MKEKKIFDALTEVRDQYVEEARTTSLKKKQAFTRKRWTIAAASLFVMLGIAAMTIRNGFPFGGNAGSGGAGHTEGSIFMSYAGPVFPLTLKASDDDIIAERNISYDFSLATEESLRVWGASVKDSYILSNSSTSDKKIMAVYPFAGSFMELGEQLPVVSVDKHQVLPELYAGGYSGGFTGVYGSDNPDGSENILQLDSWEGYKSLMEDGNYQNNAFSPYPELSQQVTVYTFTGFQAPEEYDAATQAISFTIDPDKTMIMQYGFNGGEYREDGFRRFSYFVPRPEQRHRSTKLLIVIGDDITDYNLEGYKNGACEAGNVLEGVSATVTRSVQDLSQVMRQLIGDFFEQYDSEYVPVVSKDMFLGAVTEFFYQYGLLSESVRDRYQYGMVEDIISETNTLDRVFYLEFPITVPAGGSITITADMHKEPSYDFYCSGSDNKGIQGYDMVTRLGSNLLFARLTAELISTERIEIVRQNFGFDLSQGVTRVELSPGLEHYYLEIRPLE